MFFEAPAGRQSHSSTRHALTGALMGALAGILMTFGAAAQENSGFLDDYSDLEEVHPGVLMATIPDPQTKVAAYDSIMIDQPEFIVARDSKYSRVKPDDMKLIADTLRQALMKSFERSSFRLVSTPGPTTLYLRTGITDVGLEKKHKRLIQFTPIGLAATLATSPMRDVMDKIELKGYTLEAEVVDSSTGDFIGHLVDRSRDGRGKGSTASWEAVERDLDVGANRFRCRLENTRLTPDARIDCFTAFPLTDG